MRVHFIYTETKTYDVPNSQLGLESISAVLKKAHHKVSLSHFWKEYSKDKLFNDLKSNNPDIIGITSNSLEFPLVRKITSDIKSKYKIPIIVGGFHPTINPEEVISEKNIDIACVGEGEEAMLELVEKIKNGGDILNIKNLYIKKNNKIFRNEIRNLIANLDILPFPDHSIFDYQWILDKNYSVAKIMASRGCPFNCGFCCNNILKKIYLGKGNFLRKKSVSYLLKEIKKLTGEYKFSSIEFTDDLFTLDKKWLLEFCQEYSKQFHFPFTVEARADTLDEERASALKSAGCSMVRIGVETGNEWLRNKIIKKNITNKQIIKAFSLAKREKIRTVAYNIIGFPFETEGMIKETWNLNKIIDPDLLIINIFQPFIRTDLWEICRRRGLLTLKNNIDLDFHKVPLKLVGISNKTVARYFDQFEDWMVRSSVKTLHPRIYPLYLVSEFVLRSKTKSLFRFIRDVFART